MRTFLFITYLAGVITLCVTAGIERVHPGYVLGGLLVGFSLFMPLLLKQEI